MKSLALLLNLAPIEFPPSYYLDWGILDGALYAIFILLYGINSALWKILEEMRKP
jgi:hypothetical protein